MTETASFQPGGYQYIRGPFQYSGGVAAEPGFAIERVRFQRPIPLKEGFERIEKHLAAAQRPFTAFCACELRSPEPFSEQGFIDFNRIYVGTMETRMAALGVGWPDSTVSHAYTVHDLHPFLAEEIVKRGAAAAGLTWVYARPPVVGLEYEMDVRGVHREHVIV